MSTDEREACPKRGFRTLECFKIDQYNKRRAADRDNAAIDLVEVWRERSEGLPPEEAERWAMASVRSWEISAANRGIDQARHLDLNV